jgi:hypothetical protein
MYPPVIKHGNGQCPIEFDDFPTSPSISNGFSIFTDFLPGKQKRATTAVVSGLQVVASLLGGSLRGQ